MSWLCVENCHQIQVFDVVHKVYGEVKDKFVEIDDMIAPIISLFNKKGYITEFSCSSHALKNEIVSNSFDNSIENVDEGTNTIYITFKRKHRFQNLPTGWYSMGKSIFYVLPQETSYYGYYRNMIDVLENMLSYVTQLPCIKRRCRK